MQNTYVMKKAVVVSIIFLFVGLASFSSVGKIIGKESATTNYDGNTLYVGGDGPGNYTSIQLAIFNASDGDTIYVYSGTYVENLNVFRKLTFIGEDKETTIIDGNASGNVVSVSVDWIDISGFTIRNGVIGVLLDGKMQNSSVSYNIIKENSQHGLRVMGQSDYNIVYGNIITDNGEEGISFAGFCDYNVIAENVISNNHNGTVLQAFAYGEITGNTFEDNAEYGLCLVLWCNENRISQNNFLSNGRDAFHFTSVLNRWSRNYWNRPRIFPKAILGSIGIIPWFNFDLIPAKIPHQQDDNSIAVLDTSMGVMKIELYNSKVPFTVENFIQLAHSGFFDGLVFHRVVDDFVIQGGGYFPDGSHKESPYGTIDLEIHPDIRHVDGAISMARTSDPNSATSQFFICDGRQKHLDDEYAAFGRVIVGLDVLGDIASVDTTSKHGLQDWPVEEVVINSVTIIN